MSRRPVASSYPTPFHPIPFHPIPPHSILFHPIPFHSTPFHPIPPHSIPLQPTLVPTVQCCIKCSLYIICLPTALFAFCALSLMLDFKLTQGRLISISGGSLLSERRELKEGSGHPLQVLRYFSLLRNRRRGKFTFN